MNMNMDIECIQRMEYTRTYIDKEGSRDMSMIMSNEGENLLALGPIKESIKIYVVEPGPPSSGVITKAHSWLIALCATFMMSFLNFKRKRS